MGAKGGRVELYQGSCRRSRGVVPMEIVLVLGKSENYAVGFFLVAKKR